MNNNIQQKAKDYIYLLPSVAIKKDYCPIVQIVQKTFQVSLPFQNSNTISKYFVFIHYTNEIKEYNLFHW